MAITRWQRTRPWLSVSGLVGTPTMRPTTWIRSYSAIEAGVRGERIETGHGFSWLATDDSGIWATNAVSKTVTRIHARTLEVTNKVGLLRTPAAIARGADAVWVVCANGWLWRFRPDGLGEGVARLGRRVRGLACDDDSAWVLHANGDLVQVDQASGETAIETKVGRGSRQRSQGGGALLALCLWIACGRRFSPRLGTLVPVETGSLAVGAPLELPSAPRAIADHPEVIGTGGWSAGAPRRRRWSRRRTWRRSLRGRCACLTIAHRSSCT